MKDEYKLHCLAAQILRSAVTQAAEETELQMEAWTFTDTEVEDMQRYDQHL